MTRNKLTDCYKILFAVFSSTLGKKHLYQTPRTSYRYRTEEFDEFNEGTEAVQEVFNKDAIFISKDCQI